MYIHSNSKCTNLNEFRFDKANTNTTAKKLSPTEDSFHLHLLRCAYQLLLWRQCIFAMIEIPEPSYYRYEKVADSQGYFPKLMNQSPAAPELLNDLIYNCNSNSCSDQCSCFLNGQPCTLAYKCEQNYLGLMSGVMTTVIIMIKIF